MAASFGFISGLFVHSVASDIRSKRGGLPFGSALSPATSGCPRRARRSSCIPGRGSMPDRKLQQSAGIKPTVKPARPQRWTVATAMATAIEPARQFPNPQTIEEVIGQAQDAIRMALAVRKTRLLLQLLLPVDQRRLSFLDTEPRDYPCSIKEEFEACSKTVSSILSGLGNEDEKPQIQTKRIGEFENEMDPVAVLYPSDKSIAAVVFPISETLKKIKSLANSNEGRPLLLVNPQWQLSGQIVSDFGFGPWKRQAEDFLRTFEPAYMLLEQRIGEASNVTPGSGGVVRLLRCFPGDWHIYLMSWDGSSELIGVQSEKPSYRELEHLVTEARKRIPWKAPPRMLGGSEPAPPPLPKSLSGFLSEQEINAMDKVALRRALMVLNLPTSGMPEILRARLKEAQKKFI